MKLLFNDKIKKNIKNDLNLNDDLKSNNINEAYAAQPKQFTLNTDLLSKSNINNHINDAILTKNKNSIITCDKESIKQISLDNGIIINEIKKLELIYKAKKDTWRALSYGKAVAFL